MLLLIALTDSAHACLSVEPTEVYEGETVSLVLDVACVDERLGSEEWSASSGGDAGTFSEWSVNEDADLESRWTAPWLESDSVGQRVSLYAQLETPESYRFLEFVDVVVYPLPDDAPDDAHKGCAAVPSTAGWWLLAAVALLRRRLTVA